MNKRIAAVALCAFVFFPSDSKMKFPGFAHRIDLEWDNFPFRLR